MAAKMFIYLINGYQRVKAILGFSSPCRFSPTCSEYAKQAIVRHGIIRGLILGISRILKCHPWSKGGYDPVK